MSGAAWGDMSPRTGRKAGTRRSRFGGERGEGATHCVRRLETVCEPYTQPGAASQLARSSLWRCAEQSDERMRDLQEQVGVLQKLLLQIRLKEGPDLPASPPELRSNEELLFPPSWSDDDGELEYIRFSDDNSELCIRYSEDDEGERGSEDDDEGEVLFPPRYGGDDSELFILPRSCFVEQSELPPLHGVEEDGEFPLPPSPLASCEQDSEPPPLHRTVKDSEEEGQLPSAEERRELPSAEENSEIPSSPPSCTEEDSEYPPPLPSCSEEDSGLPSLLSAEEDSEFPLPAPPCINEDGALNLPSLPNNNKDAEHPLTSPPSINKHGALSLPSPPCCYGHTEPPCPQDKGVSLGVRRADIGPWGGMPWSPSGAPGIAPLGGASVRDNP